LRAAPEKRGSSLSLPSWHTRTKERLLQRVAFDENLNQMEGDAVQFKLSVDSSALLYVP
jgi:hypothetical protein